MGKIKSILVFCLLFASVGSVAGGFDCPSQGVKIEIIQEPSGQAYLMSPNVQLPMGNEIDAYQTRWGIYHTLIAHAHSSIPYMPEWLMVFHMMKSQKVYQDGFKLVDDLGSKKYQKLTKLYCSMMLNGITKY